MKGALGSDMQMIDLDKHEVKVKLLWWQEKGLQFTASGYGSKIPTGKMVKIGKRWHRIYYMIWSNAGSCYIMKGKQKIFVH